MLAEETPGDLSVEGDVLGAGGPARQGGRSPRPLLQLRELAGLYELLCSPLPAQRPLDQEVQRLALGQPHPYVPQRAQQAQRSAERRLLRAPALRTQPRLRLAAVRLVSHAHAVEGVAAELALQHGAHGRLEADAHPQVHAVGRGEELGLVGRPEVGEGLHLPQPQLLQSGHLREPSTADSESQLTPPDPVTAGGAAALTAEVESLVSDSARSTSLTLLNPAVFFLLLLGISFPFLAFLFGEPGFPTSHLGHRTCGGRNDRQGLV